MNQGLHWHRNYCGDESTHKEVKYRLKMTQVLRRMQLANVRGHSSEGSRRHVSLYQQTSAQHFGSEDGDYDSLETFMGASCRASDKGDTQLLECGGGGGPNSGRNQLCSLACKKQQNSRLWRQRQCTCRSRNLRCHDITTPFPFAQNWRNTIIDDILKVEKFDHVHLIPFHNFTIRRGKAHVMMRPGLY